MHIDKALCVSFDVFYSVFNAILLDANAHS